jgi:hypothetical protein
MQPERISHTQVKVGDAIVVPGVGRGTMVVDEIVPGGVGGLLLRVHSSAGQLEVHVPWREEILRVSSGEE